MYHLACVCRALVPEIHEILRVFQYIDVLTCVVYNMTEQTILCRENYQQRQVLVDKCADTWYK